MWNHMTNPIETSGFVADATTNDYGYDIMMVLLF